MVPASCATCFLKLAAFIFIRHAEVYSGCLQVETSLHMHATDNVTVIVVCLTAEAPPKREYGSKDKVRRSFSQNSLDTLKSLLEDAQKPTSPEARLPVA